MISAFCLIFGTAAFAVRIEDSDVLEPPKPAEVIAPEETAPAAPEGPRQITLAVFDFTDDHSGAPGIGRAVADMLIGSLADDGVIRLFERGRLDEILEEQKHQNPSDMDGNTIRAARIVGVQFVLTGKVSEFGISENGVYIPGQGTVTQYKARTALDLRLVRVSDAAVVKTWTATGSRTSYNLGVNVLGIPNFEFRGRQFEESLLGKSTREAVDSVAAQIKADVRGPEIQSMALAVKLNGRVADVDGNDLIINIGSLAGVQVGQSMIIFRQTKKVLDPDTGELLTEKRDRVGELLVLHVEERYSEAAVMDIEPGATVNVGDEVEQSDD